MPSYPNSALKIKELAEKLVKFLRGKIEDTHGRKEWSKRNLRLLREFPEFKGAVSCPSEGCSESLWDFVAFVKGRGILIAAESEWCRKPSDIEYDFKKLLYAR
jgi:hypothetical protein